VETPAEVVTPRLAGGPFLVFDRHHTTPLVPAVVLERPRNAVDVALVIQTCRAFGVPQLWISGGRVELDPAGPQPAYQETVRPADYVSVVLDADPVGVYAARVGVRVVAVERGVVSRPVEWLGAFVHPARVVYVFGPEDGDVSEAVVGAAATVVEIPSRRSINLVAAVGIILGDRAARAGNEGAG
jgi:tRNA(Leu) C34 or U34 (ribose-2'-O)-methylase TrmL